MPKPEKPKKPNVEEQILQVLIFIFEAIGRQNKILRDTETNNQRRHEELLKAVAGDDASSIVFTKIRREQIPEPTK